MCDYCIAEKELSIIEKIYDFVRLNFVDNFTLDKIEDAIVREDIDTLEQILKGLGE